jgi:pimeloyl-ACP methyl ester carboxylesterase
MSFEVEMPGEGAPVLFLPGSYSTARAWAGVMARLEGRWRISVSLPGYGATPETRGPDGGTMADMLDWLDDLAGRIGTPFHLVGHSFGGQIALAAALSGGLPLLSLVSFEGNPIYGRRAGADFPWRAETAGMLARFSRAVAAGDPQAPALIIDYWSRPGVFAALPAPVRDFCVAGAATNLLDWKTAQSFAPDFAEFAGLSLPCTICRGALANPAIVDVSETLHGVIPDSHLEVVDGADHFLISTHPDACAALVAAHLGRVEAAGQTPP